MSRSTARARVFKSGPGRASRRFPTTWFLQVIDSDGRIVNEDNGGTWPHMVRQARCAVDALRVIENQGHRLSKTWDELVDEADPDEF